MPAHTDHPELVVLSNRGPYRHGDQGRWVRSSGGLVTALDPMLRQRGGVWVSAADPGEEGEPPDLGYRQARVRMPDDLREGFYCGIANGVLWPALHGFPRLARPADAPWTSYLAANRAFAEAALAEARPGDLIWVHDYHLMTAPRSLRTRAPELRIGWFCHVPWPDPDQLAVVPWREQILEGLLGADVIGFHTASYAAHFLDCVERLGNAEVEVDRERGVIETPISRTRVIARPIGIPTRAIAERVHAPETRAREGEIRKAVGGRRIVLGVDRLDYTKGIPERLAAFERLLEDRPELADEVVLVQIVVPSREDVPAYTELREEIDRLVGRINGRFGHTGSVPIHYLYHGVDPVELYAHYRAADVALVTPLRDGMNLVALEYVASRTRTDGALVLSEFAGAAEWLDEAYTVNPHDTGGVARELDRALHAPLPELRRRMRALRATVESLDVNRWAEGFLAELRSTPLPIERAAAKRTFRRPAPIRHVRTTHANIP